MSTAAPVDNGGLACSALCNIQLIRSFRFLRQPHTDDHFNGVSKDIPGNRYLTKCSQSKEPQLTVILIPIIVGVGW